MSSDAEQRDSVRETAGHGANWSLESKQAKGDQEARNQKSARAFSSLIWNSPVGLRVGEGKLALCTGRHRRNARPLGITKGVMCPRRQLEEDA
jgi:hypothetical protein